MYDKYIMMYINVIIYNLFYIEIYDNNIFNILAVVSLENFRNHRI